MMAATGAPSVPQVGLEFITVNGVRIAYADTGGPEFPSCSSMAPGARTTTGIRSLRAWPDIRVVAYDRRGHSESDRPPGQGHFSEDVADLRCVAPGGLGDGPDDRPEPNPR